MQCVILAGGLGTRIRDVAPDLPKCLIPVAGRPFAALQLEWLAREGVDDVVYCVGHLAEQVRSFVGDGSAFGLTVRYADEGDVLLGTAGALRLAADLGLLAESFFVLYGDSYLDVKLAEVRATYVASGAEALMTVFRNEHSWEESNVVFDGSRVLRYEKHCPAPPADMVWVDYGLSILRRLTIVSAVAEGAPCDLALIYGRLSSEGDLLGYEATHRFFEIGSPSGLQDLEAFLRSGT
jgi:NDP-sugar pyrophosphorylase family protein